MGLCEEEEEGLSYKVTVLSLDRENSAQLLPAFLMALMRVNVRRANFPTNPRFEVKKLPRFA